MLLVLVVKELGGVPSGALGFPFQSKDPEILMCLRRQARIQWPGQPRVRIKMTSQAGGFDGGY